MGRICSFNAFSAGMGGVIVETQLGISRQRQMKPAKSWMR
jgi:hypothetical protein